MNRVMEIVRQVAKRMKRKPPHPLARNIGMKMRRVSRRSDFWERDYAHAALTEIEKYDKSLDDSEVEDIYKYLNKARFTKRTYYASEYFCAAHFLQLTLISGDQSIFLRAAHNDKSCCPYTGAICALNAIETKRQSSKVILALCKNRSIYVHHECGRNQYINQLLAKFACKQRTQTEIEQFDDNICANLSAGNVSNTEDIDVKGIELKNNTVFEFNVDNTEIVFSVIKILKEEIIRYIESGDSADRALELAGLPPLILRRPKANFYDSMLKDLSEQIKQGNDESYLRQLSAALLRAE